MVNASHQPLYPREWNGTHCTGGWVGPTTGLDGAENLVPSTEIRFPNRPACSKSLYRLSSPGPQTGGILQVNLNLVSTRGGCAASRPGRPSHWTGGSMGPKVGLGSFASTGNWTPAARSSRKSVPASKYTNKRCVAREKTHCQFWGRWHKC